MSLDISFSRVSRCFPNSSSGQWRSLMKVCRASSFQNRSSDVPEPLLQGHASQRKILKTRALEEKEKRVTASALVETSHLCKIISPCRIWLQQYISTKLGQAHVYLLSWLPLCYISSLNNKRCVLELRRSIVITKMECFLILAWCSFRVSFVIFQTPNSRKPLSNHFNTHVLSNTDLGCILFSTVKIYSCFILAFRHK